MKYYPDYSNYQTLKNYWIRYYLRYYPSISTFKKKLLSKNNNISYIKKILSEMQPILQESKIIESHLKNFIDKWKDKHYIINKLKIKWFKEEDIKTIIENNLGYNEDWKNYLKKTISNLIQTKSIKEIRYSLYVKWFNKELVDQVILEFANIIQDELIQKLISQYSNKGFIKEKIIQKLILKGFSYWDFKEYL